MGQPNETNLAEVTLVLSKLQAVKEDSNEDELYVYDKDGNKVTL